MFARRLVRELEFAADELALTATSGDRLNYARDLLAIASEAAPYPVPRVALALAGSSRRRLEWRIGWILGSEPGARSMRWWLGLAGCATVVLGAAACVTASPVAARKPPGAGFSQFEDEVARRLAADPFPGDRGPARGGRPT
jgi:hypothetical protein